MTEPKEVTKHTQKTSVADLFSDLASPTKQEILYLLQKKAVNTSQLSKNLKISVQATQKHVKKLLNSRLIEKNTDNSKLSLSTIGQASLQQLLTFDILFKHQKYFSDHSFDGIPSSLAYRLGELINSKYVDDVMEAWQAAKNMNETCEKYMYGLGAIIPLEFYDGAFGKLKHGVKYKLIYAKNSIVPKGFHKKRMDPQWQKAIKNGQVEERYVERLSVVTNVTDKENILVFADKKTLQVDPNSIFISNNIVFHKWCYDLFFYYWDNVKKIKPFRLEER